MEMHQIRYFLAVADCLNFTRAAETCNVTQPALTRAIQKLEEELGGLLFRRERKLTHLTDLGHLVRPQLEAILSQSEQAKTTAKSFLQLKDAPLKLGRGRIVTFSSAFAPLRQKGSDGNAGLCFTIDARRAARGSGSPSGPSSVGSS